MHKYIVQHTHIKHAGKGEKEAVTYAPGDEIELTEKEAQLLGNNVKITGKGKNSRNGHE